MGLKENGFSWFSFLTLLSPFAHVTMRKIWSSKHLFLLVSVTKQEQSGRFTPQQHPRYSVALLPSVSPWLLHNINLANKALTQKFSIALTFFFLPCTTACPHSTHARQCCGMYWTCK